MSKGQWEDDDLFGEGSDLGDDEGEGLEDEDLEGEEPEPPAAAPPPPPPAPVHASGPLPLRTADPRPRILPRPPVNGAKPRRLKVKPMSTGMRTKWPDVTSCLLTLTNGQQVMFVRG